MDAHTGRPGPAPHGGAAVLAMADASLPAPRKGAARPAPARNPDYAHLTIEALREYRGVLAAEENKVSYWRRILQARLDVMQAGSADRALDHDTLRPVLTSERVGAGRRALVEVLPVDDIPPLPSLDELWDRRVEPDDVQARLELEDDLREAEGQLSAYRRALHGRIADATGELIARYREQPTLCLTALPLAPPRSSATA